MLCLERFYHHNKCEFQTVHKVGSKQVIEQKEKDVAEPWELVQEICTTQRNLDHFHSLIRIGIDGGQGSLKVVMNIFNPEQLEGEPNHKNTRVNKAILIAIARGVEETNFNLGQLLNLTNIHQLQFYLAADLKLINCLLGLSVKLLDFASKKFYIHFFITIQNLC